MYSNDINDIHNYAHFLLRGIYHNYIHSETGIAISRLLIFIILIIFIIYAKYDYLLGFIVVIAFIEVMSTSSSSSSSSSWLNIWSELRPFIVDTNNQIALSRPSYTFDINHLTNGVSLNTKEGFEIFGISRTDDSGTDYHNRTTSVDKNSQEFSDKFFENKKCNNGLGSIVMSGTNELIGQRSVYMSSTYDYANKLKLIKDQICPAAITINGTSYNKNDVSNNDQFQQYCYNYFFDCVYQSINRSRKASGNTTDFRDFKKDVYNGINDNIMKIDDLLGRFNLRNLKDASDNRIVGNIINSNSKDTTDDYGLYNINEINDKSDAQFGDFIDKESTKTDIFKARRLEIYNRVYQYKNKLNEIFTNWKNHSKNYNINVKFISVNDNVLNDLSEIINFIILIKMSFDIVNVHNINNLYGIVDNAYKNQVKKMIPYGFKENGNKIIQDTTNFTRMKNTLSNTNIYNIPQTSVNTSYTLPDEERFLYGISYFYNNISY